MASVKGKLVRWFGGLVLTQARVEEVTTLAPAFRRIVLTGEGLRSADWQAGDKVQVLLPTDETRTYTPLALPEGRVALIGWCEAGGPGASWIASVAAGAEVPFLGPQRSLRAPEGRVVVVGDETSIAVAASFGTRLAHAVLAVRDADAVERVCDAIGVTSRAVVPRGDASALSEALAAAHTAHGGATFTATGGASLIVSARQALRARGVTPKVKTYWAPGKTGLD